jgi:3-methyl-2-oxobutanoate hydroxymethyltransferase
MRDLKEIRLRKGREKITMLTAYDYQTATILDEVGVDLILVGDSLGVVIQGSPDTKSVTMEDMLYHTRAVARGSQRTPIIADMPINSYNTREEALANAMRLLKAGAHGVKLEGNKTEVIKALMDGGVPVMGHLGLLPQIAETYHVRGKDLIEAQRIFNDATQVDDLGVLAIVLECIPEALSRRITESVKAPTIGIGAGKYCDGQVLVINDMLGLSSNVGPKFVKRYADLNKIVAKAITTFKEEVASGEYPDKDHTYH